MTLGRLGDMFGRVRIYTAGFAVFTAASILLFFDPFATAPVAKYLRVWLVDQDVSHVTVIRCSDTFTTSTGLQRQTR